MNGLAQQPVPPPAAPLSLRSGVEVLRRGEVVSIRSDFSPDQDVVIDVGKGTNRQINFQRTRLVPRGTPLTDPATPGDTLIHGCGDDATPWNLNGTYIGGNHGCSDGRVVTSPQHGRTAADLGTEWKDEAGNAFYLLKIADADKLWFLGANSGTGAIWRFANTIKGNSLTRAEPAHALPVAACQMVQLTPACRIARQDYLLNGAEPVPDGTAVRGRHVDIVEEYDIINPGDLLQDFIAHPGQERSFTADHLKAVVRNRITYRFLPHGATLVLHDSEALQDFRLGYMGFIQTAKLATGSFARHDYYIPRTLPFVRDGIRYDFQAGQDYRAKLPSPLRFGAAEKNVDPAHLPERFIQLLGESVDGRPRYQVGYAVGYSLTDGLTVPAERARNVNSALMLYTSSKTYPSAIDSKMPNPIPAGTVFRCSAYRQYFNPALCAATSCLYWHADGRDLVVCADFHRAADRVLMPLPVETAGKPVSVIDKTASLTLHDTVVAATAAVTVSVTGEYGYAVLKIAGAAE